MSAESDLIAALNTERQRANAASILMKQAATLPDGIVLYLEAEGVWSDAIQQALAVRELLAKNPGLTDTNVLLLSELYPQDPNMQGPLSASARIYRYSLLRADAQVGAGKTPSKPILPPIDLPPGNHFPGAPTPEPSTGVPNWLLYLAGGGLLYFLGARYLPRRLRP